MGVKGKLLLYRIPVNRCRRDNGNRKLLFHTYQSNKHFMEESSTYPKIHGQNMTRNEIFTWSQRIFQKIIIM